MDLKKIDPKLWTFLILVSLGLIMGLSYLIISEVLGAKKGCETLEGKYNFKIIGGHFCNGRSFILYNSCMLGRECESIWVFEDLIDETGIDKSFYSIKK